MDLLPKVQQEFAQPEYWETFFKKRGSKAFEWYGEYLDLCDQLHKYIKKSDKVLVVGCGNSKLGMDLYDSGICAITSIDISKVAIKQMTELNKTIRPQMEFLEMDATKMSFPNENMSVVLDKGTLDALMTDDSDDTKKTITKYCQEISRVLKNGGRYICISLLQQHILNFILDYFSNNNFLVRIIRCYKAEKNDTNNEGNYALPVFVVVMTKLNLLSQKIFEVSLHGDKIQRMNSINELSETITSIQRASLVCNGLNNQSIAESSEVRIDLFKPGESTRYFIFILDQSPLRGNTKYAAFIVPQGREVEWLFSTPEGRKKLATSAKCNRLAIVILDRSKHFSSLDEVKAELSECIRNLAPRGIKEQIPFLSLGTDVGERNVIGSGSSEISGDWVVEDVKIDDSWYRRIIFQNNQFVVQSEVRLKTNKENKKIIDFGYLACKHHGLMTVGIQYVISGQTNSKGNVLIVGLGGGALCTFIHRVFKNQNITAVEIDESISRVAETYFGLKQDERLDVVIEDGLDYLLRKAGEGNQFSAILFDVDNKDSSLGMSCPPKSFLESNILDAVKTLIGKDGIFIVNLVCRSDTLRNGVIENLKSKFETICFCKVEEDLNEIIYCQNVDRKETIKSALQDSCKSLNQKVKKMKISSSSVVDVTNFLENIKI